MREWGEEGILNENLRSCQDVLLSQNAALSIQCYLNFVEPGFAPPCGTNGTGCFRVGFAFKI